jgi:hypothetical protein
VMDNLKKLLLLYAKENLVADKSSMVETSEFFSRLKMWHVDMYGYAIQFRRLEIKQALTHLGYVILQKAIIGYRINKVRLVKQYKQQTVKPLAKPKPSVVKLPAIEVTDVVKSRKRTIDVKKQLVIAPDSAGQRIYKKTPKKRYCAPTITPPINDDFRNVLIKTAGKDLDECCEQAIASIHALREKRKQEEIQNFYKDIRYKK